MVLRDVDKKLLTHSLRDLTFHYIDEFAVTTSHPCLSVCLSHCVCVCVRTLLSMFVPGVMSLVSRPVDLVVVAGLTP